MDAPKRVSMFHLFADPANDSMIRRRDLRALGVTDGEIDWALAHGDLVSRRRGVLEPPGIPDSPVRQQRAALLAVNDDDAVLSHLGSAGALQLPRIQPGALELTVFRSRAARLDGVTVHVSKPLDPIDVVTVRGLRCTSMARTVVDIAPVVHPKVLRRVLAHVERRQRPNGLDAIAHAIDRVGPKRRPHTLELQRLLERLRYGDPALDIGPRVLAAFARAGVPAPRLEHPVTWRGVDSICDAAFVAERIDVEFDDDHTHATVLGTHSDKDRDRRARRSGWEVERVHQDTDPKEFALHIRWLLDQRRRRTA